MKFTTALTLFAAFTSGAHSLAVNKPSLKHALNDLGQCVHGMLDAAKAFTNNVTAVEVEADKVIKSVGAAQTVMDAFKSISLIDAIDLIKPVRKLEKDADELFAIFKERLEEVKKANACALTRNKLEIITVLASKLTDTMVGKLDSGIARSTARPYAVEIKNRFSLAKDLLSEANCPS